MKELTPSSELRDLPPIQHLLPNPTHLLLWVSIVALIIVIVAAIKWLKQRRSQQDPGYALRKCIADCLKEIENLPASTASEQMAHMISLQVRRYLHVACKSLALYQTQEELLYEPGDLTCFPEELRMRLGACLDEAAKLKYAPRNPSSYQSTVAPLRENAIKLLNEIHQHALTAATKPSTR